MVHQAVMYMYSASSGNVHVWCIKWLCTCMVHQVVMYMYGASSGKLYLYGTSSGNEDAGMLLV